MNVTVTDLVSQETTSIDSSVAQDIEYLIGDCPPWERPCRAQRDRRLRNPAWLDRRRSRAGSGRKLSGQPDCLEQPPALR
jgi:hypothetical protein